MNRFGFCYMVLVSSLAERSAAATVDFGAGIDPPLVKKFSQYNAGLPPPSNYDRDLDHIVPLRSDHLRLDLGMGKGGSPETTGRNVVSGTAENPIYDFSRLDRLARMLLERDVLPYYAWCYVPYPLQRRPGDYKSMRDDAAAFDAYRRFHKEFGAHYAAGAGANAASGLRMGYHEIYNEPDLQSEFLTESFEHYLKMYKAGATGIREGDPDAVVGGPALAMGELFGHARQFTDFVKAENLPLDFFSFHHYWVNEDYDIELGAMLAALGSDVRFRTVPVHINELNWSGGRIGESSVNNRHAMASHMFAMFERILESHDVVQTSWAQFMESTAGDDAYGIIHREGRKKAAYNAFKIYADMPEDRKKVVADNPQVGAMASASGRKAALVAWNRGDASQAARFDFSGLPFPAGASGRLRVHRIDGQNASSGDGAYEDLKAVETRQLASMQGASWSGTIPGRGVVYLTLDEGAEDNFQDDRRKYPPARRPGRVLRTHHYFPARGQPNYAYFDRKSWSARLGMGAKPSGYSLTGVRADSLPAELMLQMTAGGNPRKVDANSLLGIRIDYAGPIGKSVLVHWGLHDPLGTWDIPWGTGRRPDTSLEADSAVPFPFRPATFAPPGWNGKAVFSFVMRNTGEGSRAVIEIRRPGSLSGLGADGKAGTGRKPQGTLVVDARGLRLTGEYAGTDRIELRDRMGRHLRTWDGPLGAEVSWNGDIPPPGLYYLRFQKGKRAWIRPIRAVF